MFPTPITAGDTLTATAAWSQYPSTDGWNGFLRLIPRAGAGGPIDIVGQAADDGTHLFVVDAATTASWTAGDYGVVGWVERGGEVHTTTTGDQVTVAPDPRTATAAVDTRSLARRTRDDLIAARAAWASSQGRVRRYKVGDREREFATSAELNAELEFWESRVLAEQIQADAAAGKPPQNRVLVRFTRPR